MKNRENYIYGINSVRELLETDPGKIHKIIIENLKNINPRILDIVKKARSKNIKVQRLKKRHFSKKFPSSRGIAAEVNIVSFKTQKQLMSVLKDEKTIIAFDGINDPHNLGAIIRTSYFFGVKTIVLPRKRCAPMSPVVSRSSAGAVNYIQPYRVKSIPFFLKQAKKNSFRIICADSNAKENITKLKTGLRDIIVFGSEGKGLSSEPRKYCDEAYKIDSQTNFDSLNLSNSVAVFLFKYADYT